MKYLSLLIFILILSGCSRSASSVFKKDPQFSQNLQYTKIGKIVKEDEVNAIINVTYLNSAYKEYNDENQNFLVSVYIPDEKKKDLGYFRFDKKEHISKKEILKTDDMYKNIALKNRWANYFIYSFKDNKKDEISLQYIHPEYGTKSFSFKKE